MPKIDAPSVAEHRAQTLEKLVRSAESLLRADQPLTAGAVSKGAGLARNSIYRYVDSVDELRVLAVSRYLPSWMRAVEEAVDGLPAEQLIPAWVEANLQQSVVSGHGWLMRATQAIEQDSLHHAVDDVHASSRAPLIDAWTSLIRDEAVASMGVALTMGLVNTAFVELESSIPNETVLQSTIAAARSLVDALRAEDATRGNR